MTMPRTTIALLSLALCALPWIVCLFILCKVN